MTEGEKTRLIRDHFFVETPEGHVLAGSKCKSCGKVFFPKKTLCTACFNKDNMEIIPLRRGRLVNYAGDERDLMGLGYPHFSGYVKFPEGPRIFSLLTGVESVSQLKEGMEVETVVERLRTDVFGYEVLVFKFKPILEDEIK